MSYQYSGAIGLTKSEYRPAGQIAVYDHIVARLRDKMPSAVYQFGGGAEYATNVDITYALEYPEKLLELPFVALTFVSEMTGNVGIGQVPAGVDFGEYSGITKNMILQIDVWGRNSMERDMVADAIMYVMHTSRHHFSALGFRDVFPNLSETRMFEQADSTLYPKVAQTTSRVWRKIMTFNVEYDLIWVPPKDVSTGIIEQIDIEGTVWDAELSMRIGHATDLILDSKYALKRPLRRFT